MTHGSTVTYKRHSFRYFPPHLGVRRRIGQRFGQVVAASHDPVAVHDHRPDGHFSFIKSFAGFVQSLPHEKFIAVLHPVRQKFTIFETCFAGSEELISRHIPAFQKTKI